MKGNAKLIEALNQVLTSELTAVNQYVIHARMCSHRGFEHLAKHTYDEALDEMKHADEIIRRILFLEGVPNLQRLSKVKVGESVPEQLKLDRELEVEAIELLNRTMELATAMHDNGTRQMLETILRSEERQLEWLEAQNDLLAQVGEKTYLAQQIRE